jgi:hypothetical protein
VPVELTAELLDGRGIATETARVAGIVPFVVLKALAYDDRFEEKDAYDLIYCLMHYGDGPTDVAAAFRERIRRGPPDHRKDGPTSYARFLADPGRTDLDARHRRDAAVVEQFLRALESHG